MIISRNNAQYEGVNITIEGNNIKIVPRFNLVGWLREIWEPDRGIKSRIQIALKPFYKYKKVLASYGINVVLRMRYARCYL